MKLHSALLLTSACICVLLLSHCKSVPRSGKKNTTRLYEMMTGSFSSQAQAEADSNFYSISLHMYPIWQKKYPGEHWLYVEQALFSQQERPYRQRVYHIKQLNANEWESSVYLLPQPEDFIMKWKSPQAFEVLSKEDLSLREGCSVFLTSQKDGSFAGSTQGQDCASELRGASYASSKVSITTSKIESWDQGFDTSGAQVWGATTGGYVFDRLK